ncbi:MAG: hypothetical protein Q7J84_00025 [Sulfuricaulis sp.]|nr:hypothetical protein [Sulfuricaulis sp.]
MSDPEKSGWTLSTLKSLMDERDRRYGEIAAAKETAINAALAAAEKAVMVAERNAEKWRDNANEWRQAMTDRERNFLPRNIGYIIGALTALTLVMGIADKLILR